MPKIASTLLLLAATFANAGDPTTGGGMLRADRGVPAGLTLFIKRVNASDTIRVRVGVGFDPGFGSSGDWSIVVPAGLSRIGGPTAGRGPKRDIEGPHELLLRCERWGTFPLEATMTAVHDSLNFVRNDFRALLHVTADSFTVQDHPTPLGFDLKQYVINGIRYRQHGVWWLPLDPGEDEEVEPGFDSSANLRSAPVLQVEAATRAVGVPRDSSTSVPVWVAVDRNGRVKDARLTNPNREPATSPETKAAALAAAWKWRFAPAHSLGRPVSTIYVIKVPVATASDH